jgi:hypothetical protein
MDSASKRLDIWATVLPVKYGVSTKMLNYSMNVSGVNLHRRGTSRAWRRRNQSMSRKISAQKDMTLAITGKRITGEVSVGFRRKLSKVLKIMVGPCGFEPQTSTVSIEPG